MHTDRQDPTVKCIHNQAKQGENGDRFVKMPYANEPPNYALASYHCDDCCEADYVDTWTGGDIREFWHDTERGLYICDPCKRLAEARMP